MSQSRPTRRVLLAAAAPALLTAACGAPNTQTGPSAKPVTQRAQQMTEQMTSF